MDFEYELKKAKEKFGENSNVIRLKKINIEEFKEYINKVSQEENIYGEDLKEKISKEYNDMLYDYLKISGTGIVQKQVQAIKTVNNNKYILDKIYEKVKNLDLNKIDFEKNVRSLKGKEEEFEKNEICVELNWIREQKTFIDQSLIEKYKKMQNEKDIEKRKMYKEKLERKFTGKEVMKTLEIFAENTEKGQLAKGLKNREK